jgi:probable HAF family extracellular repeat protein
LRLWFAAGIEDEAAENMSTNINLVSIKILAIPGATQMSANDINDEGQIVGQFTDALGSEHGFVYKEDSFCQLDYPGASATEILGINNLGQMVGMFTTLAATCGFLYDRGTFSSPLTFPGAGNFTVPNAINDRGEIVGVYQDAVPGEHSFLYKAGTYQTLVYPGAQETGAQGINNSGQVVGGFPDAKGTHGFVYLENVGVFTPPLDCPTGTLTALRGINNGGQIVGGCFDPQGNEHPFLYVAGALNPILVPSAISASANAINDCSQVVGNLQSANGANSFVAAISA